MTTLNQQVSEEVRVHVTRRRTSLTRLAETMGVDRSTLTRKLGAATAGGLTLHDVERIGAALQVPARELLGVTTVAQGLTTERFGHTR